jgi:iron(III) transport system ATP-binding protein
VGGGFLSNLTGFLRRDRERRPSDGVNQGRRRGDRQWGPRNIAGVAIASAIRFEGVTQDYGNGPVVEDVGFSVDAGQVTCLLGPSGSGKSTLLRVAAGIEAPLSGSVLIDGRVVTGPDKLVEPERRGVGLVFQDYALFPHMPILANVAFGLPDSGSQTALREAMRMLERVGLADLAGQYPHQLSGGEQQRVALARALAPRPGILLMDEPFSGLDSRLRDSVRDETLGLLRDTRSTAIIVTHDPEEAMRVSDRIALMRAGCLVQFGACEEMWNHPADLFAAGFFSELNRIDARAQGGMAATPIGAFAASAHRDGERLVVAIRHSGLVLKGEASPGSVAATIISRRFLGMAEAVEIAVAGMENRLHARIPAASLPPGLRQCHVTVDRNCAFVFAAPAEE